MITVTQPHADFHARCDSYVRISAADLAGPSGPFLSEITHPATARYPDTPVGWCELALFHQGRCEMSITADLETMSWITWDRPPRGDRTLPTAYTWVIEPANEGCQHKSANGLWCGRPSGHEGGHCFIVQEA